MSNWILKVSKPQVYTVFLGNLGQCFSAFILIYFFIKLEFMLLQLIPFTVHCFAVNLRRFWLSLPSKPPYIVEDLRYLPTLLFPNWTNPGPSASPGTLWAAIPSPLGGPPLDFPQLPSILHCWLSSWTGQMWTHMSWVVGNILSPVPAGSALANATSVQLVVIATRAHWWLVFKFPVRTHPKGFFCKSAFLWLVFRSFYWCMGLFCV